MGVPVRLAGTFKDNPLLEKPHICEDFFCPKQTELPDIENAFDNRVT